MKICHIQTVLYVENQLFYVTDFFYLTSKKSVFFDNFHNFIRKSTKGQGKKFFFAWDSHGDF